MKRRVLQQPRLDGEAQRFLIDSTSWLPTVVACHWHDESCQHVQARQKVFVRPEVSPSTKVKDVMCELSDETTQELISKQRVDLLHSRKTQI